MSSDRYPDYIARNQKAWSNRDSDYAGNMRAKWASEASWGIWNVPEEELQLLPDVDGRDALDIGCGAAYVCAWLARRGARVTGIDPTLTGSGARSISIHQRARSLATPRSSRAATSSMIASW